MTCRILYWLKQLLKGLVLSFSFFMVCGAGCSDFSEKVGNGYYYHRINSIDQIIAPKRWNDTTPIIPAKVVVYKITGRYVAAKREVIKEGKHVSEMLTGKYDFWILDTLKPEVFGPMDKRDFVIQISRWGLSRKW